MAVIMKGWKIDEIRSMRMNESIKTQAIPPTNMEVLNVDSIIPEIEIIQMNTHILQWKRVI